VKQDQRVNQVDFFLFGAKEQTTQVLNAKSAYKNAETT
jgi:hypothetical protein